MSRGSRRAMRRAWLAVMLASVALPPAAHAADALTWSMYNSYSQSYFIEYARGLSGALSHATTMNFNVSVAGHTLYPTMDTGSTGLVISANVLGLSTTAPVNAQAGWVFYNSSGLLLTGYFSQQNVQFSGKDANGAATAVVSNVPVLVVTQAQCLGVGANSSSCDAATSVNGVQMMGIGFDRNTMGTGVVNTSNPTAAAARLDAAPTTPQIYNPFLNVVTSGSGAYRNGYIITPTGVYLGLTEANTSAQAYSYAQLALAPKQTAGAPQWLATTVTVTVTTPAGASTPASSASGKGTLLMDTGVEDAFIGIPNGGSITPASNTVVTLQLGNGIGTYSFTVPSSTSPASTNPQTPTRVSFFDSSSGFINSGLHTYAGYNVLYDADGGFIGLALNNYPGSTAQVTQMIAAQGTLNLTSDFATNLPVLLIANATVATASGSTATFNSDFTGTGQLTLQGGSVTLNGQLTHSGGTVVASGTTQLGGTLIGSLSVLAGATFLDASGGYTVAAGRTLSNAGTFTGPSSVSVSNAGTVVNSGTFAVSFSNSGTATNTATGAFTANIANSGVFLNAGSIAGNVTNTGQFTSAATGTVAGTVQNSGRFTNNGSIGPGAATPPAIVANTGVFVNAGGITGNVSNAGQFTNNGTITGTVENTGTFGGNGTVGHLLVRTGGALSPGNSIGTHVVRENATFEPGAVLLAELGTPGTSDRLLVGGTLTAGGAVLVPIPGEGFAPALGAGYRVFSAGTTASNFTVGGPYFGTAGAVYPFLSASLGSGADSGLLTLNRSAVSYAALAPNANAAAVGRAADTVALAQPLGQALAVMPGAAAPAALASLSGEIYASAQGVLQVQSSYVRNAVTGRLAQAEGAPGTAQLAPVDGFGTTLWGQAYGGWGSTASDGNASAVTRSLTGFLIGLDGRLSDWRVGVAGGYSQSDFSTDSLPGSGTSDNYDLALYAGRTFAGDANGAFALRAGAAYGWHDLSVSRTVTAPGLVAGYGTGYSAGTAQVFGELAYTYAPRTEGLPVSLEPFAGLAYTALSTNGFTEPFGPAALRAQSASSDTLSTTLGLRARTTVQVGAVPVALTGSVGWQHAFGDVTPTTTFTFAAGSLPFTVAGAPLATDALLLGLGAGAKLADNLDLSLAYNGQIASGFTETAVKGILSWRF